MPPLPKVSALVQPVLQALLSLGGEASTEEMRTVVARALSLTQEQQEERHRGVTGRTELEYRLAWARTRLKKAGKIEARGPRRWGLTDAGRDLLERSVPAVATNAAPGR